MIVVRPYRESDLDALTALVNEVIESGDAFVHDRPFSPEAMRDYLTGFTAAFVADDEGRVLGGYLLRPNLPGRASHTGNAAYMVGRAARGRGLGRLLGEHSLAEAPRLGFSALQFNAVVAENAPAVALWKSLGFTVIGTSPRAFRRDDGRLVDLLIMHRFV